MPSINLKVILLTTLVTVFLGAVSGVSQTMTYTYDDFNRLQKTEYAGGAIVEYSFDKVGNRQTESATFGLKDVIAILELLTGSGNGDAYSGTDINGDGKIGLEELIYVMQRIAGLR